MFDLLQIYPVGFHFTVSCIGLPPTPMAILNEPFQEVSGLTTDRDVEEVAEGGENGFVHQLPKRPKAGRLKLRRVMTPIINPFTAWCTLCLEAELEVPVIKTDLVIMLHNQYKIPTMTWRVGRAFIVKREADTFDAMKNELAMETIEMAYHQLNRV